MQVSNIAADSGSTFCCREFPGLAGGHMKGLLLLVPHVLPLVLIQLSPVQSRARGNFIIPCKYMQHCPCAREMLPLTPLFRIPADLSGCPL